MYDMTIRLRTDSDKCLYQQIYEHIRQEIREGKLLAGERLPSTRSLAEYLQVARSTVDYAYDQLLSEGYIEARPYKGYFVCRLEGIFAMEPREENEPEPDTSGEESVPEEGCIDFSPYGIDMNGFPVGVWKRITKNILNDNNSDLFARGELPPGTDHCRSRKRLSAVAIGENTGQTCGHCHGESHVQAGIPHL